LAVWAIVVGQRVWALDLSWRAFLKIIGKKMKHEVLARSLHPCGILENHVKLSKLI
jgi:hypothetical protein